MSPGPEGGDGQHAAAGQRAERFKKLTINLPPDYHADLVARAEVRGCTITDLIKTALALDRFVWDHRNAELLLRDPATNDLREIVLLRP